VNLGHRVALVVLAGEQGLQLDPAQPVPEFVDGVGKLLHQPLVGRAFGLGVRSEFVEHPSVVETRPQLVESVEDIDEPAELRRHLAAGVGVVPQARVGGRDLELGAPTSRRGDVEVSVGLPEALAQLLKLTGEIATFPGPRDLRRRHGRA